jgi:hypothetical protein
MREPFGKYTKSYSKKIYRKCKQNSIGTDRFVKLYHKKFNAVITTLPPELTDSLAPPDTIAKVVIESVKKVNMEWVFTLNIHLNTVRCQEYNDTYPSFTNFLKSIQICIPVNLNPFGYPMFV